MIDCWKCGACCRKAHLVEELKEFINDDGQCKYFINNTCSIYDTRPDVCNCETQYNKKYKDFLTREEYRSIVKNVCLLLEKEMNGGI